MPHLQRIIKPKTHRGKRFLLNREPKLVEDCKRAIFVRGVNANNVVLQAMKDFASLKRPNSVVFNKKNDLKPFEDASSLEFFAKKNDSPLFMFGSHNKKRPNNLVIGRTFDHMILDMFEFGLDDFKSLKSFKNSKVPLGTKPMLMFVGEAFENQEEFQRIKNLFIDFFRGPVVEFVNQWGFKHLLVFTEKSGKIHLRSYRTMLKKIPGDVPEVLLEEIGPSMNLTMRRTRMATADMLKQACRTPKIAQKKVKNVTKDDLGTTHGRIHMKRQDYSNLQTWKMKGLKRKSKKVQPSEPPSKKVALESASQ